MSYMILSFLIAMGITFVSIPVIINIAHEKKLVDVPDDRKVHENPIPALGGVGIFAGFIIALLMVWPNQFRGLNPDYNLQYIAAACLIIFFVGLKDDIVVISPLKKFIGQLIAAWIIVYKCRLQINSFYGILGVYNLPNIISLFVTYLAIVLIINSFNLIDGVDGLSSSLALVSLIGFSIFFYNYGTLNLSYSILASSLAGALVAFLIYNFYPAKIFMGDTGSLLVGLLNAILLIKFLSISYPNHPEVNVVSKLKGGPIVGLSFIFIPLFDTFRVFTMRIFQGGSPFTPDRTHIHHILLDKGFNHKKVTLILTGAAIVIILITYLCNLFFISTATLIIVILLGLVLLYLSNFLPLQHSNINNEKEDSKIVKISRDAS
jgi:UDP-GlcNAc:undecaprenyl-phosphate GlcNAc-1-phosphate transferase